MGRGLSQDLRDRVVAAIEGGMSCRGAAVRFGVSAASAIRWHQLSRRHGTPAAKAQGGESSLVAERYGQPMLVRPRLGQGAFRLAVTDGYDRRCSVSGDRTLPILDAAHVKAFADGGEHESSNGLLLRTDIHRLFDLGYVTVSDDRRFEVSHRLKADFDNGKHYYDLHGQALRPPERGFPPPASEALAWHRENRYLG